MVSCFCHHFSSLLLQTCLVSSAFPFFISSIGQDNNCAVRVFRSIFIFWLCNGRVPDFDAWWNNASLASSPPFSIQVNDENGFTFHFCMCNFSKMWELLEKNDCMRHTSHTVYANEQKKEKKTFVHSFLQIQK